MNATSNPTSPSSYGLIVWGYNQKLMAKKVLILCFQQLPQIWSRIWNEMGMTSMWKASNRYFWFKACAALQKNKEMFTITNKPHMAYTKEHSSPMFCSKSQVSFLLNADFLSGCYCSDALEGRCSWTDMWVHAHKPCFSQALRLTQSFLSLL